MYSHCNKYTGQLSLYSQQATNRTVRGSNTGDNDIFSSPKASKSQVFRDQLASSSVGIGVLSRGKSGRYMKLTTHLHLVPALRTSGAIHQLLVWRYVLQRDVACNLLKYEGCSESKERLRLQPAQLFRCTRSVIWCVQQIVDSYLVQLVQRTFSRCECNGL